MSKSYLEEAQIQEAVEQARELALKRFKAFDESLRDQNEPFVQDPEDVARIIRQSEWLAENCEKVRVNKPGCRVRYGYTEDSIKKMLAAGI